MTDTILMASDYPRRLDRSSRLLLVVLTLAVGACGDDADPFEPLPPTDPPFSGTIFLDPDIITDSDISTFETLSYAGQDSRSMFDRRVDDWIVVDAYLFDATFDDGLIAEVQVNPESGSVAAAQVEAEKYAAVIGRLPRVLRTQVEAVWIHQGTQPFGGGNRSLLIHTGQAVVYEADGILEETLVHEASHTSLDAAHATAAGWTAAQNASPRMLGTIRCARTSPRRSCPGWPSATDWTGSRRPSPARSCKPYRTGLPISMHSSSK
jgi:hypothetical protein